METSGERPAEPEGGGGAVAQVRQLVEAFIDCALPSGPPRNQSEYVARMETLAQEFAKLGHRCKRPLVIMLATATGERRVVAAGLIVGGARPQVGMSFANEDVQGAGKVIRDAARQGNDREQYFAAYLLAQFGADEASRAPLAALLRSPQPHTQVCAAAALVGIPHEEGKGGRAEVEAVHILERAILSFDGFSCAIAGQALAASRRVTRDTTSRMANALKSAPPVHKHVLVTTMATMRELAADCAGALAELVCDKAAGEALRGHAAFGLACVVGENDKDGQASVRAALSSEIEKVRQGALQGMSECSGIPSWAFLEVMDALESKDKDTQWSAVKAIANSEPERAAPFAEALMQLADNAPSIDMLSAIAEAVAKAQEESIEVLVGAIQSMHVQRLPVVAMALQHMGKHGATLLRRAVDLALDECKIVMPVLLRELGPAAAPFLPVIQSWLNEDEFSELAEVAARTLGEWGPHAVPAIPDLVRCVARGNGDAAFHARRVLLAFGALAMDEVERFKKTATPEERARLESAFAGLLGGNGDGALTEAFITFGRIDKYKLRTFVWIAEALADGPLSYDDIAERLRERHRLGEIVEYRPVSGRMLQNYVRAIEEELGAKCIDSGNRSRGPLTQFGAQTRDQVRRFLEWDGRNS